MVKRFVLLVASLMLVTACNQPVTTEPVVLSIAGQPFIRGTVVKTDAHGRALVQATDSGSKVQSAWVRSDEQTRVTSGGGIREESLTVGQTVSVWIAGPVVETLPVQVVARTIVVE